MPHVASSRSLRYVAGWIVVVAAAAGIAVSPQPAAAASPVPSAFAPIEFLLGDWVGAGTSDAGPGSGGDSFALALDGHVVERHAHSYYPASAGKAAETYDGLMVIYPDASSAGGLRADSYDNGGHVIHYTLVAGTAPNVAQFISEGTTGRPTFRLTYELHGGGDLGVLFELAPPGSASFTTVANGVEHRKAGAP